MIELRHGAMPLLDGRPHETPGLRREPVTMGEMPEVRIAAARGRAHGSAFIVVAGDVAIVARMTRALHSPSAQQTLREFCASVYGAQCLVDAGEMGPRVSMLMRYAGTLLDALDVELLDAGVTPGAPEFHAAQRLRERFDRLALTLTARTLRKRSARATHVSV